MKYNPTRNIIRWIIITLAIAAIAYTAFSRKTPDQTETADTGKTKSGEDVLIFRGPTSPPQVKGPAGPPPGK